LLADLANRVSRSEKADGSPHYTVDFTVATLPDYVDSNSGWLADQVMAAVQSGMAQEGYLFDRVKLVDWSRASTGPVSVLSASRLHERQPGAIVFRKVTDRTIRIEVVMLVLETPTAGVHQIALRNSLWFLRTWNACTNGGKAPLRILGPSFSGSTVSLASVIGEPPIRTSFDDRIVITGSATADENAERMAAFSNGAIFRATVQTTKVLKERMADYLTSLNSKWEHGDRVALLNESNTTYGGDATSADRAATPPEKTQRDCSKSEAASQAFACAKVFNFPLHVAQLRSDALSLGEPGAALLTNPVIPLNMREATPPSDLIPALRPQLTSPVVESTVDSILDAIRHEKISAVGIFATDDRDVLFLAREVKRAVPDVQLFLFGTHGLYLHPDYLPYLRGALVASSYALTLANQPEIKDTYDALHRQPFPSMTELMPVARMADDVLRDFRSLAFSRSDGWLGRNIHDLRGPAADEESRLGVRPGDLESLEPLFAKPSHVSNLEREMQVQEHAAIIQSEAWFRLWRLSDSLVTLLQRTRWLRSTTVSPSPAVRRAGEVAEIAAVSGAPLTAKRVDEFGLGGDEDLPHDNSSGGNSRTGWFKRCEQLVALQMAFVLRDIVARTVTCLFAAMLCLTLLTASHLFYTFNGRASLLMIDMLAIAGVALSSIWVLVDMERDHVLSRLRATTPGRVDINWDFIKRIAVYGVLPLLAVIASLFPEVGGTLFGWLEPLRKLSSF
jgi:hypothetical protein